MDDSSWVLGTPFRAHARLVLSQTRAPWRVLAIAAGVEPRLLHALLFGRAGAPGGKIPRASARRLLAVEAVALRRTRATFTSAGSTGTHLRHLAAAGFDDMALADFLGCGLTEVGELRRGERGRVSEWTALHARAAAEAHGCLIPERDELGLEPAA